MRRMLSLTAWYMWRSFINALKRHWKLFLGIIIFILAVVGIALFASMEENRKKEEAEIIQVENDKVTEFGDIVIKETDGDLIFYENGKSYTFTGGFFFEAVAGIVILLLLTIGIRSGAKNGVNIFSMADVNFLFPSPNKPQNVLVFKMVAQIGVALVGSIYILFQMPSYIAKGVLTIPAAIILFVLFFFVTIAGNYLGIFTYILVADRPRLRKLIEQFGMALVAVPVLIVVIMKFVFGMGLVESAYEVISGTVSRFVPFVGWIRYSSVLAVEGQYLASIGMFLLSVALLAVATWIIWQKNVDFYEDSLTFAVMQQEMIQKLDDKTKGGMEHSKKHDKRSEQKRWDKRRNKGVVFDGFEGGKVFFAKSVLGRKRMYGLGGVLSGQFVSNLLYGLGFIALYKILDLPEFDAFSLLLAYFMLILFRLFANSFVNPIRMDLGVNFIYMIPEKPISLLGWDMLGYVLDGAIDLLPIIPITFYFSNMLEVAVVAYLTMLVLHFYFGMMALMVELVIKSYLPKYLSNIIQIILKLLPFVITIAIVALLFEAKSMVNLIMPFVLFIIITAALTLLALWPCCVCLHKGRK